MRKHVLRYMGALFVVAGFLLALSHTVQAQSRDIIYPKNLTRKCVVFTLFIGSSPFSWQKVDSVAVHPRAEAKLVSPVKNVLGKITAQIYKEGCSGELAADESTQFRTSVTHVIVARTDGKNYWLDLN